jgi:hypothetical protein
LFYKNFDAPDIDMSTLDKLKEKFGSFFNGEGGDEGDAAKILEELGKAAKNKKEENAEEAAEKKTEDVAEEDATDDAEEVAADEEEPTEEKTAEEKSEDAENAKEKTEEEENTEGEAKPDAFMKPTKPVEVDDSEVKGDYYGLFLRCLI